MKAIIKIGLDKEKSKNAIKAIKDDLMKTKRVEINMIYDEGLKIMIDAKDLSSMRAALNSTIKLLQLHNEVIKCLN